VPIQQVLM